MVDAPLRRLTPPNGRLRCLAAGPDDAPLVLLLHGFPDIPRTFTSLMHALAGAGYRAVAPSMPGYAPSTLKGPFDADTLVDHVMDLADHLSPEAPFRLVGHDWGAVVTHAALEEAPARIAAAVTMAVGHPAAFLRSLPRHPSQLRRSWYMGFFQLDGLADHVVAADDFAFVARLWRDWSPGYSCPPQYMDEVRACFAASMPAPLLYYRHNLRDPATVRRGFASNPTQVPTLHLHGADDGCISPLACEGQERFFAGPFESVVVPRAGHFLHLERPAEVESRVLSFFSAFP